MNIDGMDDKWRLKDVNLNAASLMPYKEEDRLILNKRADHYAKLNIIENKLNQQTTYVRFRLANGERYGIPFQYVKEITHNSIITKVPCTPEYIAGVFNRRSALTTVLDLKYLFQIQSNENSKDTYIIVVINNNMMIGILADGIDGSDNYDMENLNPPIVSEGIRNMDYVSGIHNGSTTIINIESILADPELSIKRV